MAVGAVVWIGLREGRIELHLFFSPSGWWWDVGLGAAGGALLLVLWEGTRRSLPMARELEEELRDLLRGLAPGEALALAGLSGLSEEMFFRGAVQESWGWLWATLLFSLLHTGRGAAFRLWTLSAAVAGSLFGGLMLWRGNLLAPILAHASINAVSLYRITTSPSEAEKTPPEVGDGL